MLCYTICPMLPVLSHMLVLLYCSFCFFLVFCFLCRSFVESLIIGSFDCFMFHVNTCVFKSLCFMVTLYSYMGFQFSWILILLLPWIFLLQIIILFKVF